MKAPARAECTWGEGPDVLVIVPSPGSAKNGWGWSAHAPSSGDAGSFGCTAQEARALAAELIAAADHAEGCDREFAAHCAHHAKSEDA